MAPSPSPKLIRALHNLECVARADSMSPGLIDDALHAAHMHAKQCGASYRDRHDALTRAFTPTGFLS